MPRSFIGTGAERALACRVATSMANGVSDILDDLDDLASSKEEVSLGDVVEKVGGRGQGAFLALPGLVGMTPVGGIPGVPTLFGITVAILSLQMLAGRSHLWLPGVLAHRSVEHGRLQGAVKRVRRVGQWTDRHCGQRLEWAAGAVATRIAAIFAFIFACLLPPLEIVPFAALIPFTAIALLGLALMMRDGLLLLLSFAASSVGLWGIWRLLPFN